MIKQGKTKSHCDGLTSTICPRLTRANMKLQKIYKDTRCSDLSHADPHMVNASNAQNRKHIESKSNTNKSSLKKSKQHNKTMSDCDGSVKTILTRITRAKVNSHNAHEDTFCSVSTTANAHNVNLINTRGSQCNKSTSTGKKNEAFKTLKQSIKIKSDCKASINTCFLRVTQSK